MRSSFLLGLFAVASLAGCTVKECPPDLKCIPANDNGAGGASGAGGKGSGGAAGTGTDAGGNGTGGDTDSGPPPGEWVNVTANLANVSTTCGTVSGLWTKPDGDALIIGVARQGVYTSSDGASSWQQLGTGKGSSSPGGPTPSILFDPDHPDTYWVSVIHVQGQGAIVTTDGGKTFANVNVGQSDALGIDFTDKDRKTMLAGAHETGDLYLSVDSGAHFQNIGGKLPGNCTGAVVIDAQTFLLGCNGYTAGVTGVLRSTDQGKTWKKLTDGGGYGVPLRASDDSLYWTNAAGAGVVRSTDDGETWTKQSTKGPVRQLVELPDKRLASLDQNGAIVLSSDQGVTWKAVSRPAPLPQGASLVGLAYSVTQKAFFYAYELCAGDSFPLPDDTVQRFDFDWETQ